MKKATFAAGCFWGVQNEFDTLNGVVSTEAGYMGGTFESPSYEDVCTDETGHAEAVQVIYDETRISYEELLEKFWDIHDPTQLNRQGVDEGTQYRSAIFYHDETQKETALRSKQELEESGIFRNKIVTEITPATKFWPAEDYHQHYIQKNGPTGCKIKQ
jgi:peptide-methionine (S)-S-oxide reductase